MIDERYQGKGYGKHALQIIIDEMFRSFGCDKIYLSMAPNNSRGKHIPRNRYFSIVPSKEFQIYHYKQREWVPYVLSECKDKEKAFLNWMERDALFALNIHNQCKMEGYSSIINDGSIEIETLLCILSQHFGLE